MEKRDDRRKVKWRKQKLFLHYCFILEVCKVIKILLRLFLKHLFPHLFILLPHPLALNNWSVHFSLHSRRTETPAFVSEAHQGRNRAHAQSRIEVQWSTSRTEPSGSVLLEAFPLRLHCPPTLGSQWLCSQCLWNRFYQCASGQILLALQNETGPKKGSLGPPGTNLVPQEQPPDTFVIGSDPH